MSFSFSSTVGGIYTVIKTKAPVTVEEWGEQYCLIGPYNESCVRTEVEILEPHHVVFRETIGNMRRAGFKVSGQCQAYEYVINIIGDTHSVFKDRNYVFRVIYLITEIFFAFNIFHLF